MQGPKQSPYNSTANINNSNYKVKSVPKLSHPRVPRDRSFQVAPNTLNAPITRQHKASTRHIFYISGRSARDRRVRREEEWVREAFLGQGAYGVIYKEKCHDKAGPRFRAVKEIKKRVAGEELDYTRELEAIVKFSHPKVARSH